MSEAIFASLIGAAAVLLGVLFGAALPWFRDAQTNKRNARYLAIRMVCILDQFLDECTNVVGDDRLSSNEVNAEGYLEPQVSQPKELLLPRDVDWRSIGHELMYKILSLPNRIEHDNRSIAFAPENSSPPDFNEFFEKRQYSYACLGLDIADLTQELRSKYGIPMKKLDGWNPVQYLENEKNKINMRKEDRDKRLRKELEV